MTRNTRRAACTRCPDPGRCRQSVGRPRNQLVHTHADLSESMVCMARKKAGTPPRAATRHRRDKPDLALLLTRAAAWHWAASPARSSSVATISATTAPSSVSPSALVAAKALSMAYRCATTRHTACPRARTVYVHRKREARRLALQRGERDACEVIGCKSMTSPSTAPRTATSSGSRQSSRPW